jgi:hypothetical protein
LLLLFVCLFCFLLVCASLPINFFSYFCCCFIIVGFLSLLLCLLSLFSFLFLYYQLYHHDPLIPTLISFMLHPSPVLKSIATLSNNSFFPLTHSVPQALTFPSHSLPTCHQTTLPLSHSSPIKQPTILTLYNPKHLQSLTQTPSSTTTEIYPNTHESQKQQPPCCFPH